MTTALEQHLLNDFQRDFPLSFTPFGDIAKSLGVSEQEVLENLRQLQTLGLVSRVGAVFRPHRIGASTLVAMAVPDSRLAEVAQMVSACPEVNHNYAREHYYNLWFVMTAADEARLQQVLNQLAQEAGCPLLNLPMLEEYYIDLGFSLRADDAATRGKEKCSHPRQQQTAPFSIGASDRVMIAALQAGLPLVSRPYAALGRQAGMSEQDVMARLSCLLEQDVIKRIGVIVRHQELGYRANAMVVWDIPDAQVAQFGQAIGEMDYVTLCYRRPRRLPDWRYNLFSMIHGHDRDAVLELVEAMRQCCGLQAFHYEVLFSRKRFKQRGAHYVTTAATDADAATVMVAA